MYFILNVYLLLFHTWIKKFEICISIAVWLLRINDKWNEIAICKRIEDNWKSNYCTSIIYKYVAELHLGRSFYFSPSYIIYVEGSSKQNATCNN